LRFDKDKSAAILMALVGLALLAGFQRPRSLNAATRDAAVASIRARTTSAAAAAAASAAAAAAVAGGGGGGGEL